MVNECFVNGSATVPAVLSSDAPTVSERAVPLLRPWDARTRDDPRCCYGRGGGELPAGSEVENPRVHRSEGDHGRDSPRHELSCPKEAP